MSGKNYAEPAGTRTCTSRYTGLQALPALIYTTRELKKLAVDTPLRNGTVHRADAEGLYG
jgi:hypothetical protein